MILLNEQPFSVVEFIDKSYGKEEAESFKKKLSKMVYQVPTRKIKIDRDNGGLSTGGGQGILTMYRTDMDLSALKKGGKQQVTLRYYEKVDPHPTIANEKTYSPPLLQIGRSGKLTVEQLETNWFLYNHPKCENGVNRKGKPQFCIFTVEERREQSAKKTTILMKALNLVRGEREKLTFNQMKALAEEIGSDISIKKTIQHNLYNSKAMNEEELRYEFDTIATKHPEFLVNYYTKSSVIMREKIEHMREKELISFVTEGAGVGEKGKWYATLVEGKPELLCVVMYGKEPETTLMSYFKNSDMKNAFARIEDRL